MLLFPAAMLPNLDALGVELWVGARAIWSQWDGYLRDEAAPGAKLRAALAGRGVGLEVIHTSGHASIADLKRLVAAIGARSLVPVHLRGRSLPRALRAERHAMRRRRVVGGLTMAGLPFRRGLPSGALALLKTMPPWWRDVLDHRFSDNAGVARPLLIAVRDGYLNVYVEGQSVLRIGFDARRSGEVRLRCHIHAKYVGGPESGDTYLKFDGEDVRTGDGRTVLARYEDEQTLRSWVKAARTYSGDEKRGVAVIAAQHPEVIDVEVALPANTSDEGGANVANRMDVVALEEHDGLRLAFYEAKLFSNSELRARNFQPRVLKQLLRYEEYVSIPARREQVIAAYRAACSTLVEIATMRRSEPPALVRRVAEDATLEIGLDPKPRLIIFDCQPEQIAAGSAWEPHAAALRRSDIDILLATAATEVKLRPRAHGGEN